jgi:hypothetical protein
MPLESESLGVADKISSTTFLVVHYYKSDDTPNFAAY